MRNYGSIQDLRALSNDIYSCVENSLMYGSPAVDSREGVYVYPDLSVEVLSVDEVDDSCNFYPLDVLVRMGDDGTMEADGEAADEVAGNYVFVR